MTMMRLNTSWKACATLRLRFVNATMVDTQMRSGPLIKLSVLQSAQRSHTANYRLSLMQQAFRRTHWLMVGEEALVRWKRRAFDRVPWEGSFGQDE
mmetsp:Transcript_34934/g.86920  ORF Transcript_34934/g.86920 Transcript_34934/m.86920 type:complete len:96 (+) Transcript_34934:908-1195(+)